LDFLQGQIIALQAAQFVCAIKIATQFDHCLSIASSWRAARFFYRSAAILAITSS
jgi:hypothetical protein